MPLLLVPLKIPEDWTVVRTHLKDMFMKMNFKKIFYISDEGKQRILDFG